MATGSSNFTADELALTRRGARSAGAETSITESDDTVRNLKASESVVAAFQAAGVPSPPGDLAAIITTHVKSATSDIPLKQIASMTPGSGSLGTSAAAGVNMFFSMLTPTQRDALKVGVNPLDPAAMMKFSAALNQGSAGGALVARGEGGPGGRVSSDAYTRELAGGSIFKALASEGYSAAQISSAINYARDLGTSEDMARKFVKLDQSSRNDLSAFVDEIRNDPTLSDEQKAAKVGEFRKAHPKIGKTISDKDMLQIIRGDAKNKIHHRGLKEAAHHDSQETVFADKAALGVAQQTLAAHRDDVAASENKPEQGKNDLDAFAAIASRARSREVAEAKPDPSGKPEAPAGAKSDPKGAETAAAPDAARSARAPAKSPSLG